MRRLVECLSNVTGHHKAAASPYGNEVLLDDQFCGSLMLGEGIFFLSRSTVVTDNITLEFQRGKALMVQ